MQEEHFKYYCYACQKHFESSFEAYSCKMCDSCGIQSVEKEDESNGQQFHVYELKAPGNQSQPLGILLNGVGPRNQPLGTVVSITTTTISGDLLSGFAEGSYLGNLLRQLLRDGNGMTAATQEQIQKLQKIQGVKQCSICQSVNQQDQINEEQKHSNGFKLSCNHTFHQECIRPWFQRTNTCPVCRKNLQ